MPTYRTPDVYIDEISLFPPSVAEVESAIPAFVGYTEKIKRGNNEDLKLKPTKIYSFAQFREFFGDPPADEVTVDVKIDQSDGKSVNVQKITLPTPKHVLAYAMKLFFDNGGGKCYVTSVGEYLKSGKLSADALIGGLEAVAKEDEPTLLVIPEAALLDAADYTKVMTVAFKQCGLLKDRFVIADVPTPAENAKADDIRKPLPSSDLKYGAAYYPFLKTSLNYWIASDEKNVKVTGAEPAPPANSPTPSLADYRDKMTSVYSAVKSELARQYVVLPPSGAVAGVYATTDTRRGAWKAPANVGLADVIEPLVKVDNTQQDELNVDPNSGKSVNVIRSFYGDTVIWGARTLDGNSNEWRYVNVRRFFSMVEESVKKSTHWAVFEPNDANTWVKVRGMIEAYLTQKWREGALAGATPKDAFFVRCGLGTTMTQQDILEGRMNVEIGMAVVRPAEFIVLKFSHKLQVS